MSESSVNVFISWVEHRVMTIWWREPFDFEREDEGRQK